MNNKFYWLILGAAIVLSLVGGFFLSKKFSKPEVIVVNDTIILHEVDTVLHEVYLPTPEPDTFYYYEVLIDNLPSTEVDTASIIAEFLKINVYNDTIVDNEAMTVLLKEKVQMNKIFNRVVSYRTKGSLYTPIDVTKLRARLYLGGEIGAGQDGLVAASVGFGFKTRKDNFFILNNNFAYGLKANISLGAYIPITK